MFARKNIRYILFAVIFILVGIGVFVIQRMSYVSLDIPADARGAGGYLEGSYLCKDMIQKNDVVLQISTEDSPIVTEYAYTYCHNTKDSTILMLRKHDQTLHVFKYVTDEGQEYWSVLARNTRSVYPNKFFPLVPY